jgi:2-dehydropantoate 2-reductase
MQTHRSLGDVPPQLPGGQAVRVAVMGAGGIGGYVGGRFAEAGAEVILIARGAHLKALQANGLTVEPPEGRLQLRRIKATAGPAVVGPVDLVLYTVKLSDAEAAAAAIFSLMGKATRVPTLRTVSTARPFSNGMSAPGEWRLASSTSQPASRSRARSVIRAARVCSWPTP